MRWLSRLVDWVFPPETHKPIERSLYKDAVGKSSPGWKPDQSAKRDAK